MQKVMLLFEKSENNLKQSFSLWQKLITKLLINIVNI